MSGRILLDRNIVEGSLWNHPGKLRFWLYLLMSARYQDTRSGGITVRRGQWLRSLRMVAKDLEYHNHKYGEEQYSKTTIHRWVRDFSDDERITVKPTKHGLLFTILNYEKYQAFSDHGTISERKSTSIDGDLCVWPKDHGTITERSRDNNVIKEKLKITKEQTLSVCGQTIEKEILFKSLWDRYPMKDGRKKSLIYFSRDIKCESDFRDICQALQNYLGHLYDRGGELQPKNGKTWFNNWQDWIEHPLSPSFRSLAQGSGLEMMLRKMDSHANTNTTGPEVVTGDDTSGFAFLAACGDPEQIQDQRR